MASLFFFNFKSLLPLLPSLSSPPPPSLPTSCVIITVVIVRFRKKKYIHTIWRFNFGYYYNSRVPYTNFSYMRQKLSISYFIQHLDIHFIHYVECNVGPYSLSLATPYTGTQPEAHRIRIIRRFSVFILFVSFFFFTFGTQKKRYRTKIIHIDM